MTAADVAGADVAVAFDGAAEAPVMKGARAWVTPSWNAAYDAAQADLDRRLNNLVAELAACVKENR